jgi:hypothetical protein
MVVGVLKALMAFVPDTRAKRLVWGNRVFEDGSLDRICIGPLFVILCSALRLIVIQRTVLFPHLQSGATCAYQVLVTNLVIVKDECHTVADEVWRDRWGGDI